jgi:hypothetical protein
MEAGISTRRRKMDHQTHADHTHVHGEGCGHTRVRHDGHIDYLHDGHLHTEHDGHYDEHAIAVNDSNPADCAPVACACGHQNCSHESVPHGDHTDYLIDGRLHHRHSDHCDDHGPLETVA